jgi:hypothetical protein
MRIIVLLAAMLLAAPALAQTVIVKCVDAKGNISYTTDACQPGQSVEDVKSYAPVRDDPAARQRVRDIERIQADRDARARGSGVQTLWRSTLRSDRDQQRAECNAAQKVAREARGKGYSSSYLITLDRAAANACFGL